MYGFTTTLTGITIDQALGAAALGLERARLMAAQAREHVGDLWAEAREAALADVDEADFNRAAAGTSKAPPAEAEAVATDGLGSTSSDKPARDRAIPARKARVAKPKIVKASGDGAPEAG